MGQKQTGSGLRKRDWGVWHIDKTIFGRRICESTGTSDFKEAQVQLAKRIEEARQAVIYGVRPKREFREAATKFLVENQQKVSLKDDAYHLKVLDPFIGNLPLELIHMGTLQPFIESRRKSV